MITDSVQQLLSSIQQSGGGAHDIPQETLKDFKKRRLVANVCVYALTLTFVCLFISSFVCLFVCLSVRLSVCLSVCLSLSCTSGS